MIEKLRKEEESERHSDGNTPLEGIIEDIDKAVLPSSCGTRELFLIVHSFSMNAKKGEQVFYYSQIVNKEKQSSSISLDQLIHGVMESGNSKWVNTLLRGMQHSDYQAYREAILLHPKLDGVTALRETQRMMDGRDWYKNHTLNPKVIEYVVDKAIKHDKKLIEIVTNRLQDEEVSAGASTVFVMMNQTDQNAVIDSLRTSEKNFEEIDFLTLVVQESQQYLEDLTQQQIQEELGLQDAQIEGEGENYNSIEEFLGIEGTIEGENTDPDITDLHSIVGSFSMHPDWYRVSELSGNRTYTPEGNLALQKTFGGAEGVGQLYDWVLRNRREDLLKIAAYHSGDKTQRTKYGRQYIMEAVRIDAARLALGACYESLEKTHDEILVQSGYIEASEVGGSINLGVSSVDGLYTEVDRDMLVRMELEADRKLYEEFQEQYRDGMKSLEGMEIYLETIKDASKTMSTFIKSIKEMLPSEYRSSDPEEQQEKVSLFFDQIPTYIQYQERLQEQPKTDPELQEAYRAIEAMPKGDEDMEVLNEQIVVNYFNAIVTLSTYPTPEKQEEICKEGDLLGVDVVRTFEKHGLIQKYMEVVQANGGSVKIEVAGGVLKKYNAMLEGIKCREGTTIEQREQSISRYGKYVKILMGHEYDRYRRKKKNYIEVQEAFDNALKHLDSKHHPIYPLMGKEAYDDRKWQKRVDDFWGQLKVQSPVLHTIGAVGVGLYNGAMDAAGSYASLYMLQFLPYLSEGKTAAMLKIHERAMNFLKMTPSSTAQAPLRDDVTGETRRTAEGVAYNVGVMAPYMYALLKTAAMNTAMFMNVRIAGAKLQPWLTSRATGLVTSSMGLTLGNYFKQGFQGGMSKADAMIYAFIQSGLTSGIELVSPNYSLWAKGFLPMLRMGKGKVREEMVKHFAKEMVQESGQEVIQKSMEVTVNNVFDRLLSYDIRLQKDITLGEIKTLILLTSITSSGMTGKSLISQNAQLQAVREEHKGKIEQVVAMRKKLPSELHPMLDEILKGMGVDSEGKWIQEQEAQKGVEVDHGQAEQVKLAEEDQDFDEGSLRGLERLDYSWEKVRENLSLQDRVEDTALWKVRVKEIMKDIRILNRELTPEEYALIEPILLEAHRKWNNRKGEEIVDKDGIVTGVKHMEYGEKKAEYIHLVTQLSELNFLDSRVDGDTFSPLARRVAKLMMQSGLCGEEGKSNPEVIAGSLSVPKINKGIQKEAPGDMIDIDGMQEIIDTITQTIKSSTSSSPRQYLINHKKYGPIVHEILSIEDTNQGLESRQELASLFLGIGLSESQKTAIQEAHKLEDNVATILRLKRDNTFTLDQAIILVELGICGIHSSSLNYNTILKQNVGMKSNRIYTDRGVEFNVSANLETTRQDRENILSLLGFETENEQLNKKMSMEVTLERPRQGMLKGILKAKGITVEVTINTPTSFNLDLIEINRNKLPRGLKAKEIIKNIVLHAEHIGFKEMTLNADRLDETSGIPPYMMPSHLKGYAVWPLYGFQENVSYRPSESIGVINTAIHAGLQQLENTEVGGKEHFANELIIYYKRRGFDVPATAVQDVYNNYDICIQKVNKIINDYQSNTIEYQSGKRSIIQQLYSIPLGREFWYIYGQGREGSLPIDRSHSGMRQFLRHTNR